MGRKLAVTAAAIAVIYSILSSMISVRGLEDPVGPRMYPLLLGAGMAIISLLLWLDARQVEPAAAAPPAAEPGLRRRQYVGVAGASAAALVYALTMETVGYLVATFLLMLGLLTAFNRGRHVVNFAVAAGTSAVLYYGLKKFLGVPLPSGLFGFMG